MKIILSNKQLVNNMIVVEGTTEIGSIKGLWKCAEKPVIGEIYFVELSIENLHRNQIWIKENMKKPKVYTEGEYVWFRGICEDIDEVYYIRFALDWLEMVEINEDNTIKVGDCILFNQRYDHIAIYPY